MATDRANELESPEQVLTPDDARVDSKWIAKVILFQLAIVGLTILAGIPHTRFHNMSWPMPTHEEVAKFDFVGTTPGEPPSMFSVLCEAAAWSLLGATASFQYLLTQLVVKRKYEHPLILMSRFLGNIAFAVSVAVGAIAVLFAVELKIADVPLTLKNSGIGSVIAIAFLLGFFHDSTRQLLVKANKRFIGEPAEPE